MTACIGLDLSLTASGVCFPDGGMTTLKPPTIDREARLLWFYGQLRDATASGSVLVIEAPFVAGPSRGESTLKLGELYGVAWLALRGRLKAWVPPSSLKRYATGRGNSTKPDMRTELLKRTGLDVRDDNECDAYWLWAMGMDHYGSPVIDLPATHRSALGKIVWPEQAC